MYMAIGFWRPSGILPVNTPANQAMKARTPATMPITYRMMKCGIASSQCTSGRQRAIFSGVSNVSVTG